MSRISILIKKARTNAGITFRMPKMFVPVDCQVPMTAKNAMAKQLYEAGIISFDDYEKMLGVVYDGLSEEDFSDEAFQPFTEFEQSEFASYEDFEDIEDSGTNRLDSKILEPASTGADAHTTTIVSETEPDNRATRSGDGSTSAQD